MSLPADDRRLTRMLAETLYERSTSGMSRLDAMAWADLPWELRDHWADLAHVALTLIRTYDKAAR